MRNKTVAVLLAGGKSTRMGVDKGLLVYNKTFWILEQLYRISKTPIEKVYVGLGYNVENYFNAIPQFKKAVDKPHLLGNIYTQIIVNHTPELGPFSTLKTVLSSIEEKVNIIVHHIDIPFCKTSDIEKVLDIKNTVVIPYFDSKNGHPVKLSYHFWKYLSRLDVTLEDARLDFQIKKLSINEISKVQVTDFQIVTNINSPKDWKSYINSFT